MKEGAYGSEEDKALAELLEDVGRDEREALRALRDEGVAPEGRAELALRAHVLGDARAATPRASRWRILSGLAAAGIVALVAFVAWAALRDGTEPEDVWLGNGTRGAFPVGEVEDFGRFRWEEALPPSGWFQVVVRDEASVEVGRSPKLTTDVWEPDAAERAGWPDRIRWTLEVHRGGDAGATPRSSSQWAERSH